MAADAGPKSLREIARNYSRFLAINRNLGFCYGLVEKNNDDQKPTPASTELTKNDTNKKDEGPNPKPLVRSDAEVFATDWFPETTRRRLIKILVGEDCPFTHFSKGPSFFFRPSAMYTTQRSMELAIGNFILVQVQGELRTKLVELSRSFKSASSIHQNQSFTPRVFSLPSY
ncbi:hypothetical protein Pdw03_0166 [Penicillium digitatum]|uniref:Uncharacterized protein n=1 Tax=Penicillium digitatum TaxID=36651 RepID=A0A7T6XQG2_PENDI|nr:hypothetical protein Pdw03_0166 [Penicillium digitatum]